MNTLTNKLNIAKLYFQADKKRIFAAVFVFSFAVLACWAILAPQTLADDYGYYYGGDYGYSDFGSSYPSYDYSYSYGSTPSYDNYSYASYPSYSDYSYSYPSYDNYSYSYGSTPSYSDYSYSSPWTYDSYSYSSYPSSYDYSYYYPSYGYSYNSYPYSQNYDYGFYYDYGYNNYGYGYDSYGGWSDYSYDSSYNYNDTYNYTDTYSDYCGSGCYYPYYSCYSCATSTLSAVAGDLNIVKNVKNISNNDTSWNKSTDADPGDRIAFSIAVNNNSNSPAYNVIVWDSLPSQLSYVANSTQVDGIGNSSDGITSSSGINIGTIQAGQTKTVTFNTDLQYYAPYNYDYTLTNYGYVKADNISQKSDSAQIHLNSSSVSPNLSITKRVRNATKNEGIWQESTNANPGDRIVFEIRVRTTNTNANSYAYNVTAWDNLPYNMTYNSGSTRVDGNYTGDGIVSGGIFLGNLSGNQEKIILFEATVQSGSGFYYSTNTLTNTAYAKADNLGQVSDTAQIVVSGQGQATIISSSLQKTVQNISNPNGTNTDNTAKAGDIIRYTFVFTNNSNSTLNNVRIIDDLPGYLSVQNADNNGIYNEQTNQTTWNLGSINVGSSRTVSYTAKITNPPNSTVIRNTGIARADNMADITSNEVRTTIGSVSAPAQIIRAITGSNNITASLAVSSTLGMLGAGVYYFILRKQDLLAKMKLSFAIWKNRVIG